MARALAVHPVFVLVVLAVFVVVLLVNSNQFTDNSIQEVSNASSSTGDEVSANMLVELLTNLTKRSSGCKDQDDWSSLSADEMTNEQMFRYLHWSNSGSCNLAYDFGGVVANFKVKAIDGQKTVCMDPGIVPDSNNCLVYSFGINNEWSFDRTFERFGCHVYAFDPSMKLNDRDMSRRIHFYRTGLSDVDTDSGPNGWKLRTLDSIYRSLTPRHGPDAPIDYLKIDVEGSEWKSLKQILRSGMLDRVKQLGIEVHLNMMLANFRDGIRVLKELEEYGMVRFSSRVNIWTKTPILGLYDYTAYEITWYNRKFMN